MEHEDDGDTNCDWCVRYEKKTTNYSIVEISQKTKKKPRDLRRLVVTPTPVENH